jgi:serine protease Do
MAKRSMESLVKTGKVTRGYLGASVGPLSQELAKEFKVTDTSGAFVQDVTRGGPADRAGITPGDVIRKFDGRSVTDSAKPSLPPPAPADSRQVGVRRMLMRTEQNYS